MNSVYLNWSSIFSTLSPTINYHIDASNCGNCSTNYLTSNVTTEPDIVCTSTSLQSEGINCNFSVWFEYCGIKVSNATSIPLGQGHELLTRSALLPVLLSVAILIITLTGVILFILVWSFCKGTKILSFRAITSR